jgi:hypothetical protein
MNSETPDEEASGWMEILYRTAALVLSIAFAAVGLLFLFFSADVLALFNRVSDSIGIAGGPETAAGFYLGLAVSYMYLVSLIALLMWRYPRDRVLPLLLINGKAASALLSVALLVWDHPLLIYGTNAVVDGAIALGVYMLYRKSAGTSL